MRYVDWQQRLLLEYLVAQAAKVKMKRFDKFGLKWPLKKDTFHSFITFKRIVMF